MNELSDFDSVKGLSEIAVIFEKIEAACSARLETLTNQHLEERNILIRELFKVQAALEESQANTKKLQYHVDNSLGYIDRLNSALPHRWLGSAVAIEDVSASKGVRVLHWHISDVFVGGRFFDSIQFDTSFIDGALHLEFPRKACKKSSTPFIRWPASTHEANKLLITTSKQSGVERTLSSIGPSDWVLVQELVEDLLRFIPNSAERIDEQCATELTFGLRYLAKAIATHPPVLRFDHISLVELAHNGGYHGLRLKLENVVQGETHWDAVEYTLSTVDAAGEPFGGHPRIEFSRVTDPFLSGWYPEQVDDQGERFELRFETPALMDIKVWRSLPEQDKIRLVSLLSALDAQFSELEVQHPHIEWRKWRELGECMKNIIAKTMFSYRKSAKVQK
ncbi:hypothetical protein ACVWWT_002078 [Pseudomonas sp. TE6349]|uniref:hypothetical protein n=1 Tax=unclassified Pseudomonas TaxID=196821 RepID=UPI0011B67D84|nr:MULTISPECIES: hypothetical protein [unclassified Pseudomonas]